MTKKLVLRAIEGTAGIMSAIATNLGVDWHTADKYCKKYPEAIALIETEKERVLDMSETVILSAIQAKDIQTSKWYLATKGKERGYSEKHEVEHSGNKDKPIIIEWE